MITTTSRLFFYYQSNRFAKQVELLGHLIPANIIMSVIIDIPYASSPQGIKYFTIIGPHLDCMEEKYLSALSGQDRKTTCCWCCRRGALALRVALDRTAYVCGENIRVRAQVENRQSSQQVISVRLLQHVEFFIDKGVLGESKMLTCIVFDHRSPTITPNSQGKYDSTLEQPIRLPVVPPTLIGVCRLIQIYYVLSICLVDEKGNESLHIEFPLTVATVPYRIPNAPQPPMEYGKKTVFLSFRVLPCIGVLGFFETK
ncbi:unnamed protein product [Nippostrongylus brasiliensis]|uniref:Arrestin_C domain-containing protein n=1 Tax=Nippostrongylus brasiliensis TaxID=27835 RepID=A0A0N4XJC3_NIPBR|nr:unnamed protein product [Nippostrongylus brasiliensis]